MKKQRICKRCSAMPTTRPETPFCSACYRLHWDDLDRARTTKAAKKVAKKPICSDPGGPTELYRHYDADGRLLYIGISLSTITRLISHRSQSNWFSEIATIKIEHFATRAEAEAAEVLAIQTENSRFNIGWSAQHGRWF